MLRVVGTEDGVFSDAFLLVGIKTELSVTVPAVEDCVVVTLFVVRVGELSERLLLLVVESVTEVEIEIKGTVDILRVKNFVDEDVWDKLLLLYVTNGGGGDWDCGDCSGRADGGDDIMLVTEL